MFHYLFLALTSRFIRLEVFNYKSIDIVGYYRWTVILGSGDEADIVQGDSISVTNKQTPCRKFFKLREFRIIVYHFRDAVQILGEGASIGVKLIAAARVDYLHIFQCHVLNRYVRDTNYPGRRNIPWQILDRTLVTVTGVSFLQRNLNADIGKSDILEIALLASVPPLASPQENSVACVDRLKIVYQDILDLTSVLVLILYYFAFL